MSKVQIDIINLTSGQSLIFGNVVPKAKLNQINDKQSEYKRLDVTKFGFFESASPNFVTYYPDIKPEDLKPSEEGFVFPLFRGLSEVIVHKKWNPIDFSKNGVLKKSLNLLVGQSVYPNHEMLVGNELGVILDAEWQKAYKTEDGIEVPAGINVRLKIDGKAHPTIARGIQMEPPSVHSTSVTVEFAWEQSHPNLSSDEFWNKLGTFDEQGVLIRRVVTEVRRFHEISLVPHGADPFAQKINEANGNIVNPVYADKTYSLSDGSGSSKARVYFFSYKEDLVSSSENPEVKPVETNNDNNKNMKQQLLAFIAATQLVIAGAENMDDTQLTEAVQNAMKGKVDEVARLNAELTTEKGKVTTLETDKSNLQAKVDELTPNAEIGKATLEATRAEVEKAYKLTAKDNLDAGILSVIKDADFKTLTALGRTYNIALNQDFPGVCNDCQSTNVSRQSTISNDSGIATHTKPAAGTEGNENKKLSDNEVSNSFKQGKYKTKTTVSKLHPNEADEQK